MADRFDAAKGLERMRSRTREAREHEATQIFSAANIDAVLSAAAAKGQSAAIFSPSIPMDLSDAETARTAKATFEQAGFLAEWKTSRPTPESEPQTVLRVSWGVDAGQGK